MGFSRATHHKVNAFCCRPLRCDRLGRLYPVFGSFVMEFSSGDVERPRIVDSVVPVEEVVAAGVAHSWSEIKSNE